MTTQSKISSPIEVQRGRQFSWPLALVILVLGIIVGVIASNLSVIVGKGDAVNTPAHVSRNFPARPNLFELEKQALLASQARERALAAEAARYTSLGLFYTSPRAMAAESARYTNLGLLYAAADKAITPDAVAAESARYNGLSDFYGATSVPQHDREYGLAAFGSTKTETRTLAWPPRPTQFQPIESMTLNENALTTYRQSEWGLVPNKTDANSDIGLMEYH